MRRGCFLALSAIVAAQEWTPLTQRPLLRQAAEASKSGGLGATERILVHAALEDTLDPVPWFGLGMLHAQNGFVKEAASTLWASLERLHRHSLTEKLQQDIMEVSSYIQAELTKPPNCARLLCPAPFAATPREVSSQVSDCLSSQPLDEQAWVVPDSLTADISPHLSELAGPASLVPLKRRGHLMISYVSEKPCAVWPAEHISFSLLETIRSAWPPDTGDPGGSGSSIRVRAGEVVGSLLHVLDTSNFFHFIREGVASLLLLASSLGSVLVPESVRWRAWVAALLPAIPGEVHVTYVAAGVTVEVAETAALRFVDIHRPSMATPPSPFDVTFLSSYSAIAVYITRSHLRRAFASPSTVSVSETGALVKESDSDSDSCTAVGGGALMRRVVYISRNDSNVRRVLREGKLLAALGSAGKVGGWEVHPVSLSALSFAETRELFTGAAVVVGPHGAGLFNAPLFAPARSSLVAFGLKAEDAAKEDNLRAACEAVGMGMVSPAGATAPYQGDYSFGEKARGAVVAAVREAVQMWVRRCP